MASCVCFVFCLVILSASLPSFPHGRENAGYVIPSCRHWRINIADLLSLNPWKQVTENIRNLKISVTGELHVSAKNHINVRSNFSDPRLQILISPISISLKLLLKEILKLKTTNFIRDQTIRKDLSVNVSVSIRNSKLFTSNRSLMYPFV